jgi:hypothetical protein
MLVLLGDEITLVKDETFVTGPCSGIVLDDKRELERLYVHGIDMPFWLSTGWKLVNEEDAFDYEEEEEE